MTESDGENIPEEIVCQSEAAGVDLSEEITVEDNVKDKKEKDAEPSQRAMPLVVEGSLVMATDKELLYRYCDLQKLEGLKQVFVTPDSKLFSDKISYIVTDSEDQKLFKVTSPGEKYVPTSARRKIPQIIFSVANLQKNPVLEVVINRNEKCFSYDPVKVNGKAIINPDINIGSLEGNVYEGFSLMSASGDQICLVKEGKTGLLSTRPHEYKVILTASPSDVGGLRFEVWKLEVTFPLGFDTPSRALLLSCAICLQYETAEDKKRNEDM